MANAELSVSMGEVVMVKTEDAVTGNDVKPQVILQLQPITQGICEDSAETEAAIVAVDGDLGEAAGEGEEVEYGYPITCGDSRAVLLFKKFVCPGINVRCVKYNDQLISPKQFVHLAGKATLKDWKRAIRLGGVMLRKMMDSGQIDFYQHETVCTNTCRSTKFDLLINNTRLPPQGSVVPTPSSSSPQGNGGQAAMAEEKPEEVTTTAGVEWSTCVAGTGIAVPDAETKKEVEHISEDTLNFWKGIADVGLIGEVASNMRTELLALLRGVEQRCGQASLQESDAAVLHSLAQMFGMLDCVKRVLQEQRSQTDESQEGLRNTLTDLERQLEEQKKQARVRRPRSQTSPGAVFASLSGSSKPPAPKRPRLQRPVSASSMGTTTWQQPAPQFTVLSPITIGSVGQPFSIAGLPVATLAQLPAGSQVITRYATGPVGAGHVKAEAVTLHPSTSLTLLSTTAVADSGQLGAMVSPLELVHLAQEGEELAGDRGGGPSNGELVEGAGLVRDRAGLEGEDESQTHTTVIEIDPAPGDSGVVGLRMSSEDSAIVVEAEMEVVGGTETDGEGGIEVVEGTEGDEDTGLMMQGGIEMVAGAETDEEGGVVLQGAMEMVGVPETDPEGRLVLQGGIEMVGGADPDAGMLVHTEVVALEHHQDQLHNVEIVVIEEEAHTEQVAK